MAQFKIGIFGTHSTGKSSFLKKLEAELVNRGLSVKTLGGLAVEARDRGFPILANHTFESTLWMMARGISLELEHKTQDILLVDRPPVDALGYQLAAFEFRNEKLDTRRQAYLRELVAHHCLTYGCLIYSKATAPVTIDPEKPRDTDEGFRSTVDRHLHQLAETIPQVLVLDGTTDTESKVIRTILSAGRLCN